jgi:hypothetical protein
MTLTIAIIVSLAVGAFVGFAARRRTDSWCTTCGAGLRCIPCTIKADQAERRGAAPRPSGCR